MFAVQTIGLTKRYKDTLAVDSLKLDICEGELYSLLGVNGAGKTTTIKMLTGLLHPTSGDALLFGKSILDPSVEIKKYTNISPQETAVARNLTVSENLMLIAGIYGKSRTDANKITAQMLEQFSLESAAKKRAKTLSGGMQRRLSIAMALISEPKLLFLDEPTLGLDVLARRELWSAIRDLKGHMTIILTTHYMEEAEALSDRIGVMSNGRLRANGTASELMKRTETDSLEEAFVKLATESEVE